MAQPTIPIDDQERNTVQTAEEPLRSQPIGELSPEEAANSPEATALRAEIIDVGRKLWERAYVDGNGGNISVRLGSQYVLCTPTLISKRDMEPADICLVNLEGDIVAGCRPRTSEVLLHLEIYKANPLARAVVHCHPPYATAYAVTGSAPPSGHVTEYELFIGPVAVAPYETPGTQVFAESVLPFIEDHNTILLTNHGIVCWSDTPTHAEWLVEVVDTYCKTVLLAQQTGRPLLRIPEHKIREILAIKRRMGLPDARLARLSQPPVDAPVDGGEMERLVGQVVARLEGRD